MKRTLGAIVTVLVKESLDNLRDRRTLLASLVMGPLLGPLLIVWMMNTVVSRTSSDLEKPLELPVIGAEQAPNLVAFLAEHNAHVVTGPTKPRDAVRSRDVKLVLEIPPGFGEAFRKGEPAAVRVYHDRSNDAARQPVQRLQHLLDAYDRSVGRLRLLARGVDPSISAPLAIEDVDVSTPESRSGLFLGLVPYFIIFAMLMGSFYLAIDATAGERERGSLEPLLTVAVPRSGLMLGKLGAAAVYGALALLLTLVVMSLSLPFLPLARLGIGLNFGAGVVARLFWLNLPFVLLGAALLTVVASFTRSYKEAQTYLSLVLMLPLIPTLLTALNPTEPKLWMMLVPSLSQDLIVTQYMKGQPLPGDFLLVSVVSTLLIAMGLAALAVKLYRREKLLG